jgi:hypothetical protein
VFAIGRAVEILRRACVSILKPCVSILSIMCTFVVVVVVDDVVESADDPAILSSIEIIWYVGKNCMAVGTRHKIVNFQQQADRFASGQCCAECRRLITVVLSTIEVI